MNLVRKSAVAQGYHVNDPIGTPLLHTRFKAILAQQTNDLASNNVPSLRVKIVYSLQLMAISGQYRSVDTSVAYSNLRTVPTSPGTTRS